MWIKNIGKKKKKSIIQNKGCGQNSKLFCPHPFNLLLFNYFEMTLNSSIFKKDKIIKFLTKSDYRHKINVVNLC
jgi:hypothetical protein